jgi:hypothetical protein
MAKCSSLVEDNRTMIRRKSCRERLAQPSLCHKSRTSIDTLPHTSRVVEERLMLCHVSSSSTSSRSRESTAKLDTNRIESSPSHIAQQSIECHNRMRSSRDTDHKNTEDKSNNLLRSLMDLNQDMIISGHRGMVDRAEEDRGHRSTIHITTRPNQ